MMLHNKKGVLSLIVSGVMTSSYLLIPTVALSRSLQSLASGTIIGAVQNRDADRSTSGGKDSITGGKDSITVASGRAGSRFQGRDANTAGSSKNGSGGRDTNTGTTGQAGSRGPGCETASDAPQTFLSIGPGKGDASTAVITTSNASPLVWVHVPHAVTTEKPGYLEIQINGEYRRVGGKVLTDKAGAIGIRFPESVKMESNKVVQWKFSLECTKDASASNPSVYGQIIRKDLSAKARQDLLTVANKPEQEAAVYARNGFWLDAVTVIGQARFDKPNDPMMAKEWASLLNQEKLSEIAKSPIVKVVP